MNVIDRIRYAPARAIEWLCFRGEDVASAAAAWLYDLSRRLAMTGSAMLVDRRCREDPDGFAVEYAESLARISLMLSEWSAKWRAEREAEDKEDADD